MVKGIKGFQKINKEWKERTHWSESDNRQNLDCHNLTKKGRGD